MNDPYSPSDTFDKAFGYTGGGTNCWTECVCGRQHHSNLFLKEWPDDPEIESFEDFVEMSKENPDKFIVWIDEWISYYDFGAGPVVWGCPCDTPKRYEDWIFRNRNPLLRYLAAVAKGAAAVEWLTEDSLSYNTRENLENVQKIEKTINIDQEEFVYRFRR